jgi:hypothetical protein
LIRGMRCETRNSRGSRVGQGSVYLARGRGIDRTTNVNRGQLGEKSFKEDSVNLRRKVAFASKLFQSPECGHTRDSRSMSLGSRQGGVGGVSTTLNFPLGFTSHIAPNLTGMGCHVMENGVQLGTSAPPHPATTPTFVSRLYHLTIPQHVTIHVYYHVKCDSTTNQC